MKSTVIQLKEFAASSLWQDLRLAILTRLSGVRNELEVMPDDIDVYKDAAATAFLRGRAFEIRFLAELPEELMSQIERGDIVWRTEEQEEELPLEDRLPLELEDK